MRFLRRRHLVYPSRRSIDRHTGYDGLLNNASACVGNGPMWIHANGKMQFYDCQCNKETLRFSLLNRCGNVVFCMYTLVRKKKRVSSQRSVPNGSRNDYGSERTLGMCLEPSLSSIRGAGTVFVVPLVAAELDERDFFFSGAGVPQNRRGSSPKLDLEDTCSKLEVSSAESEPLPGFLRTRRFGV